MFGHVKYVSGSSFCRASKSFSKLSKSFHKSYFYIFYFADRFDEVPVRSLIKTNIFLMEVFHVLLKNSVYIRDLVEL